MRGHVAVELAAVIDETGTPYAFVCPAFPAMARAVEGGMLHVRGVPLTETPEGRDAFGAAETASVAEVLRGEGLRLAHIGLDVLRSSGAALVASIGQALDAGHKVVVFDAATDDDLACIVGVVERRFPQALLAGSAGLATAVARRMASASGRQGRGGMPRLESPLLIVSGSWSAVTLTQIDELSAIPAIEVVDIVAEEVIASGAPMEEQIEAASSKIKIALRAGQDVVLVLRPLSADSVALRDEALSKHAAALMSFLGSTVRAALSDSKVGGLVLTGGDTAYAVLSALESEGIAVLGELEPGIPFGEIMGGRRDRGFVVTKAGGFGDARTLISIVDRFGGTRRP